MRVCRSVLADSRRSGEANPFTTTKHNLPSDILFIIYFSAPMPRKMPIIPSAGDVIHLHKAG